MPLASRLAALRTSRWLMPLRVAHISDTYWYLQSTKHLMTDIADDCQAYLAGAQL